MEKELKYVSPNYRMRLDVLAADLMEERAAQAAPALTELTVQPRLQLVEVPKDDAGW